MVLHPTTVGLSRCTLDTDLAQAGFAVSQPFAASPWRQKEWQALQAL